MKKTMNPSKEMIAFAAKKLNISEECAERSWVPAHVIENAYFFTIGGRGAGRLLVNFDLESLWAASSVSPSKQIEAFSQGRRS